MNTENTENKETTTEPSGEEVTITEQEQASLLAEPTDPVNSDIEESVEHQEQIADLALRSTMVLESLNNLYSSIEASTQRRGISRNEGAVVEIALEHLSEHVGISRKAEYTAEALVNMNGHRRAELTLENISDMFTKIVEGARKLLAAAIEAIKKFWKLMTDRAHQLLYRAKKLKQGAALITGDSFSEIKVKEYVHVLSNDKGFDPEVVAKDFIAYIGKNNNPSALLEESANRFGPAYLDLLSVVKEPSENSKDAEFFKKLNTLIEKINVLKENTYIETDSPEKGLSTVVLELPFGGAEITEIKKGGILKDTVSAFDNIRERHEQTKLSFDNLKVSLNVPRPLERIKEDTIKTVGPNTAKEIINKSITYLEGYVNNKNADKIIKCLNKALGELNSIGRNRGETYDDRYYARVCARTTNSIIRYLTSSASQLRMYDIKVITAGLAYAQDSIVAAK